MPMQPVSNRQADGDPARCDGVTLVIGGARSGKSRYAETLLSGCAPPWTYLATAEAGDAEMRRRIEAHRARRGAEWRTVEAPLQLPDALAAEHGPVLVDCLTLWVSNLLLGGHDIEAATAGLLGALSRSAPCVLVTNEVGLGIVPDNALARAFRDAAGSLNQRVAALAGTVVMTVAGLPLTLKSAR